MSEEEITLALHHMVHYGYRDTRRYRWELPLTEEAVGDPMVLAQASTGLQQLVREWLLTHLDIRTTEDGRRMILTIPRWPECWDVDAEDLPMMARIGAESEEQI